VAIGCECVSSEEATGDCRVRRSGLSLAFNRRDVPICSEPRTHADERLAWNPAEVVDLGLTRISSRTHWFAFGGELPALASPEPVLGSSLRIRPRSNSTEPHRGRLRRSVVSHRSCAEPGPSSSVESPSGLLGVEYGSVLIHVLFACLVATTPAWLLSTARDCRRGEVGEPVGEDAARRRSDSPRDSRRDREKVAK
jgi:hypothetical protein